MTTAIIIGFIIWAGIEGTREALYFHFKTKTSTVDRHEHWLFAWQRGIVILTMCFLQWYSAKGCLLTSCCFFVGLSLMFSLMHNSCYFSVRNALDPQIYPLGWRSESTTSSALINFTFADRIISFFMGVVLVTLTYFIH